jgi:hypothetical protein
VILFVSEKRKFDETENSACAVNQLDKPVSNLSGLPGVINNTIPVVKVPADSEKTKPQAGEGYSWWTCLQYGLPADRSKPQTVNSGDKVDVNRLL